MARKVKVEKPDIGQRVSVNRTYLMEMLPMMLIPLIWTHQERDFMGLLFSNTN